MTSPGVGLNFPNPENDPLAELKPPAYTTLQNTVATWSNAWHNNIAHKYIDASRDYMLQITGRKDLIDKQTADQMNLKVPGEPIKAGMSRDRANAVISDRSLDAMNQDMMSNGPGGFVQGTADLGIGFAAGISDVGALGVTVGAAAFGGFETVAGVAISSAVLSGVDHLGDVFKSEAESEEAPKMEDAFKGFAVDAALNTGMFMSGRYLFKGLRNKRAGRKFIDLPQKQNLDDEAADPDMQDKLKKETEDAKKAESSFFDSSDEYLKSHNNEINNVKKTLTKNISKSSGDDKELLKDARNKVKTVISGDKFASGLESNEDDAFYRTANTRSKIKDIVNDLPENLRKGIDVSYDDVNRKTSDYISALKKESRSRDKFDTTGSKVEKLLRQYKLISGEDGVNLLSTAIKQVYQGKTPNLNLAMKTALHENSSKLIDSIEKAGENPETVANDIEDSRLNLEAQMTKTEAKEEAQKNINKAFEKTPEIEKEKLDRIQFHKDILSRNIVNHVALETALNKKFEPVNNEDARKAVFHATDPSGDFRDGEEEFSDLPKEADDLDEALEFTKSDDSIELADKEKLNKFTDEFKKKISDLDKVKKTAREVLDRAIICILERE